MIDKLEKLAKAATPGPWVMRDADPIFQIWVDGPSHSICQTVSPHNDHAYIAAANPETVLKLIAVARAAKECELFSHHMGDGSPCRHTYRHCTCGRDQLIKAIKDLES